MSFSRVNPGGWGVGAKFTSSQANQLDIDHANALDKSGAGDTLSGFINIAPNLGGWSAGVSSAVGVSAGNAITLSWNPATGIPFIGVGVSTGIILTQNSAVVSEVANGILSLASGGITSLVSGGITDGVTGGIQITQQHGLKTQTLGGNGILLNSGSSEWIDYQSTRTVVRRFALGASGAMGLALGGGWVNGYLNGPFLTGGAGAFFFSKPLDSLFMGQYNGALLSAASLDFAVGVSHSMSGVTPPVVTVYRLTGAHIGGLDGVTNLFSGTMAAGANGPGTGFGGGAMQTYAVPIVGAAAVVDTSTYEYALNITDENGGAAAAGNLYAAVKLTFSGIGNSAPG